MPQYPYENATIAYLDALNAFIEAYEEAEDGDEGAAFDFTGIPECVLAKNAYIAAFTESLEEIALLQERGIAHYNPAYLAEANQLLAYIRGGWADSYQGALQFISQVNYFGNLYNAGTFYFFSYLRRREIGRLVVLFIQKFPKSFEHNQPGKVAEFNTMEVRPWDKPALTCSKVIAFEKSYPAPPTVVVGMRNLDMQAGKNIRVTSYVSDISTEYFMIHADTWGDSTLYSGISSNFIIAPGDRTIQAGTFEYNGVTAQDIEFSYPFSAPPQVVVWINKLDLDCTRNWRIHCFADNITSTNFRLHMDTWSDTIVYGVGVSWIAFPAHDKSIQSGSFNVMDVRPWDKPDLPSSGTLSFPDGPFDATPTVLLGLNSIDIGQAHNLRINAECSSVTPSGMKWTISRWSDTILYSAGATYIARV